MKKREVSRTPEVPTLSTKAIELLTQLAFRSDDPVKPVDAIFIYSSSYSLEILASEVRSLVTQGISKLLLVTGGVPKYQDYDNLIPESVLLLNKIETVTKQPGITIIQESNSHNTLENVTEIAKIFDLSTLKSVRFLFPTYACGRGYLTLRKYCPDATIHQHSWKKIYPEIQTYISRENWWNNQWCTQHVWGEFLRIKLYGQRGDIAYDEVKDLVVRIEQETY